MFTDYTILYYTILYYSIRLLRPPTVVVTGPWSMEPYFRGNHLSNTTWSKTCFLQKW